MQFFLKSLSFITEMGFSCLLSITKKGVCVLKLTVTLKKVCKSLTGPCHRNC